MTATLETTPTTTSTAPRPRPAVTPIPFPRLVKVELRKMFDTGSGFWLLAGIGITALIATAAVLVWGSDYTVSQETFSAAIGMPMAVLLPVIAVLSVTSEFSQRTSLSTFTLVPHRGRVIAAKLASVLVVGIASMLVSLVVGALGTVLGGVVHHVDPVWGLTAESFAMICLANVLGMLMGFMLGVVTRNSPAAIVAYFVYSLVLPGVAGMLATYQQWFADVQRWIDPNQNITLLFDVTPDAQGWLQLLASTALALWLPLALGVRALLRAEVK